MANDIAQRITALTELAKAIPESLLAAVDDPNSPGKKTKKLGFGTFLKTYNRSAAEISAGLSNDDLDFKEDEGHVLRYGENTTKGVTDLAAAVNTAILVKSQNGGLVIVPDEVVGIGSKITHKSNVTLSGLGQQSTIKLLDNSNVDMIDISNISSARIKSLILDGNAANQSTEDISAIKGATVTDFSFKYSLVKNTNGRAIFVRHTSDGIYINHIVLENIGGGTTDLGGAIEINGNGGTDNEDVHIGQIGVNGTSQKGLLLLKTNNFTVDTYTVKTSDRESFFISTCDDGEISNIRGEQDGDLSQDIGMTIKLSNDIGISNPRFFGGTIGLEITNSNKNIHVTGGFAKQVIGEAGSIGGTNANISFTGFGAYECGDPTAAAQSGFRVITAAGETADTIAFIGCPVTLPPADNAHRGFTLDQNSATGTMRNITISGCPIEGNGNSASRGVSVENTTGGILDTVAVTGNSTRNFVIREMHSAEATNVKFSGNASTIYDIDYQPGVTVNGVGSEIVTATNVITAGESGTTYYLDAVGGFPSTLPAPAPNLRYTFIVKTAPTTAYTIGTNAGANLLFGTFLDIVGELVYFSAQDTLTFVAALSVVGDRLEIESDGINWYCKAFSGADGGITVSVT